MEYLEMSRRGKPGKVTECEDCAEDSAVRRTGNMIYDHKTGCSIQINADPGLTNYLLDMLHSLKIISYKTWWNANELKWAIMGRPEWIDRNRLR
jgi:hypothetical protein